MNKINANYFIAFLTLIGISFFSINYISSLEKSVSTSKKVGTLNKQQRIKERDKYFFDLTRDPVTNSIPEKIRSRELSHAKIQPKKYKNKLAKSDVTNFNWVEVGPNDIGGRTRALAIDVKNSNTIIAAGVSGGIWKSTNDGDTWELKSSSLHVLSVTTIVQDPRDGFTNIWYAAGGESRNNTASDQGQTARFIGAGLLKSIDNGESWEYINEPNDPTVWNSFFDYTGKLFINPNTGSIFAATYGFGIIKSTDDGQTFSISLGGKNDHYNSDIIQKSDGTLVAVLSENGFNDTTTYSAGIYKSTDDGENWVDITPSNFPITHNRSVLGSSNLSTPIYYVLTYTGENQADGNDIITLHKLSTDNSVSEDLSENLPKFESELFAYQGHLFTQNGYDMAIGVKPDDDDFVLLGGTSLFRSKNGFSTPTVNSRLTWIGGYHIAEFFYPNLHPDIHIITFDPQNPNSVWIGTDGGMSLAEDITDESYSQFFPWINKNNGYNVTQFYTVSIPKAADDKRIMGGTQDNGTPFFRWNDISFSTEDVSSGDGAYCYFAANKYAYTSIYEGLVYRLKYDASDNPSFDEGWSNVSPEDAEGQLFINPFVIDPNPTERYMYYPAGNTLWRNNEIRGQNSEQAITNYWEELTELSMPENYTITTLSVSDKNPEHILYYAAYNRNEIPKIYKVASSHTATTGYTDISVPDAVSGSYVHDIAVNPADGNEIIVVFSNYNIISLYHSTNGGDNYTAIEGNLTGDENYPGPSIRRALIHPYNDSFLYYVGTSTGLYSTTNIEGESTTWALESPEGIGNVVVEYLDSRTSDNTIAVATHGRGIFLGNPSGAVDVELTNKVPDNFSLSQNYPNPFNPETKIDFNIPHSGNVELTVYSNIGEKVKTLLNKEISTGKYSVNFDGTNLASGIYYYKLISKNFTATKKMILLK